MIIVMKVPFDVILKSKGTKLRTNANTGIFHSALGSGSQARKLLVKEGEGLGKFGCRADGRCL